MDGKVREHAGGDARHERQQDHRPPSEEEEGETCEEKGDLDQHRPKGEFVGREGFAELVKRPHRPGFHSRKLAKVPRRSAAPTASGRRLEVVRGSVTGAA